LQGLGYFKSVKINAQPGSAPDRVVLDVAVEEDKTGTFSIMGGYSSADGPEATISVGDKNFLGTGDIAKASLTYGEYAKGFDLSFTDPYALGPRLSLGVDLFGKETFASPYQSYDSTFYGAKVAVGTPLNDQLGMQWNYSIYNQGLTLVPCGNGLASDSTGGAGRPDVGVFCRHRRHLFDARQCQEPDRWHSRPVQH
jgi:outer membrane protein insertion porin family